MQAYAAELRARVDERSRLHRLQLETQASAKPLQLPRQVKPLDAQITELMRTLPPQMRERPWSMPELIQRLAGKYRDRPHAQQVGEALRRLGWRRERRWKKGFDGARVWVPG